MISKELTAQAIDALKQGKRQEAHDLLEQAVELDPNNAKAWYFLSRAQTSITDKRISLNTVLAISPDNQLAKDALARLVDGDDGDDDEEVPESTAPLISETPEPVAYTENVAYEQQPFENKNSSTPKGSWPRMGLGRGHKTRIGNLRVPIAIEDAPEFTAPEIIQNEFVQTFKTGYKILQRKPNVYWDEIQRASWWRFWQYAMIALVFGAIVSAVAGFLLQIEFASADEAIQMPSVLSMLWSFLLFLPINLSLLYIGIYASYWFATKRRKGQASFLHHAYTVLLPMLTAGLIIDVANFVLAILPVFGMLIAIALFGLWIYSLYIAGQGIAMAHGLPKSSGYAAMGMYVLATFLASLVLSPILMIVGLI
jgi:tetratricopeptide (TPR) repeat protein